MVLCKKAIVVGVVLTFYSSFAAALGLGEIKLNSALNQPLDADIELLHVKELTAREIIVRLATQEDFERTGVDRIYFLTDIKFQVDLNAEGGPVVKLTTNKPVREPFLDFIVSAEWPSGKLLREYTLLIDLPIFSEGVPEAVTAAPKAEPQSKPIERTRPQPTQQRSPVSTPSVRTSTPAPYTGEEYGPVGANENLWSIANRVKPDSGVSVQQTMLAIQRLNPDAFINNNINLLRRGQVLRIPDKDQILEFSSRDAISEVASQHRAWKGEGEVARPQLDGSRRPDAQPEAAEEVSGRIKLSSMEGNQDAEDGVATGDGESGNAVVESQLSVTQEELDAAARESDDLKSRIAAMDEQIETMEKLIEVSNDELRALELAAEETNAEAQVEPDAAPAVDESAEAPTKVDEQAETAVEQSPTESAPQQPVAQPPAKPEPTLVESIMQLAQEYMLYIAGGLGGLIILIAAVLFLRKRDDGFDDEFDDEFDEIQQDFFEPENDVEEPEEAVAEFDEEAPNELSFDEDVQAEAETEDVVGECDIHIAYGQYDQAEDKLLQALDKEPRNIAVRLKLLEVLAAQEDLNSFDSHYAKVRAIGDADAVDRAEQFRLGFDNAAPFDESQHDVSSFLSALNDDFESTDTQIKEPPVNENISGEFDFANEEEPGPSFDSGDDDTLRFELDDSSTSLADETSSDDITLEGDSGEFDIELDLDDDISLANSEEESLDKQASASSESYAELDSELADIDFDLPDEETASAGVDDFEDSFDTELSPETSKDDNLADFDELDISLGGDLDESGLDSLADSPEAGEEDDSTQIALGDFDESFAETMDENERPALDEPDLDFDLEKDLEDAMQSDTADAGASAYDGSLEDLDDAGYEGLADLSDEPAINEALEADVDLAGLTEPAAESADDLSDELDEADSTEASKDFDVDFDLDGEINLEELDKELGELDLEAEGQIELESDIAEPDAMDEPQVDIEAVKPEPEKGAEVVNLKDATAANSDSVSNVKDFNIPEFDPENDDDSNLDFLSDNDETATKLDLARAYIDMGDADGARDILDEIFEEGNDQQKREAETLLSKLA